MKMSVYNVSLKKYSSNHTINPSKPNVSFALKLAVYMLIQAKKY